MTREESSRINGAKSHGPTSEEGKQRSARNRISHGLTGNSIVLPGESQELFDELTAEYMDEYKPQTPTERDFATEVIVSTWFLRRIYCMERAELEIEMSRQEPKVEKEWKDLPSIHRIALAFERLSDEGKTLALLSRYETRHRRARERALAGLLAAIARRPKPDQSPIAPSAGSDTTQPQPSPGASQSSDLPTSRSSVFPFEPEQPQVAQNKSEATPLAPLAFTTCTAESLTIAPAHFVAFVLDHILEEELAVENLHMTA